MVASEVQKPQRNLPLALIIGTLAVIAIYLLTNLAYFRVLPADAVAATDRVAGEMMRRVLGSGGAGAVSIAAMISIFAALNGSILSGARVPFAMARDGLFFNRVGYVHPQHRTPSVSILAVERLGRVAGAQRPIRSAIYIRYLRERHTLWDGDGCGDCAAIQTAGFATDPIGPGVIPWFR